LYLFAISNAHTDIVDCVDIKERGREGGRERERERASNEHTHTNTLYYSVPVVVFQLEKQSFALSIVRKLLYRLLASHC